MKRAGDGFKKKVHILEKMQIFLYYMKIMDIFFKTQTDLHIIDKMNNNTNICIEPL